CDGWLRVVRVPPVSSTTAPTSPLVVALTPHAPEMLELEKATVGRGFEVPAAFIYVGLDPASLQRNIQGVLDALAVLSVFGQAFSPSERWDAFRDGRASAPVL